MDNSGRLSLTVLHDLALLYLALAHGTDEHLDPTENRIIAGILRRWQPDKDPALIDHVIREATLSYLNRAHTDKVQLAVDNIKQSMSPASLREIVHDLAEIARVDGHLKPEETGFIRRMAESWEIDLEKEAPTLF